MRRAPFDAVSLHNNSETFASVRSLSLESVVACFLDVIGGRLQQADGADFNHGLPASPGAVLERSYGTRKLNENDEKRHVTDEVVL